MKPIVITLFLLLWGYFLKLLWPGIARPQRLQPPSRRRILRYRAISLLVQLSALSL